MHWRGVEDVLVQLEKLAAAVALLDGVTELVQTMFRDKPDEDLKSSIPLLFDMGVVSPVLQHYRSGKSSKAVILGVGDLDLVVLSSGVRLRDVWKLGLHPLTHILLLGDTARMTSQSDHRTIFSLIVSNDTVGDSSFQELNSSLDAVV